MIRLYLITGFLGAGKTTLLKNMIRLLAPQRRLLVIVNEFGREGVDGALIAELGVAVDEINNGSIFCSCRIDRFEEALVRAAEAKPDVILVEASGLSDPTSIGKILRSEAHKGIEFMGSLCLVDAVNFEKVISTARVSKKQLSVSDVVVINKTDLVTPERTDSVEQLVRQYKPDAAIYRTSFGEMKPEWLKMPTTAQKEAAFAYHTKDVGLQKITIILKDTMAFAQLEKFLQMFIEETYRIKGFVCLEGKTALVDCVGASLIVTPYEGKAVNCNSIVAMAGPGMVMEASIRKAAEWYSEHVESIELGD